MDHIKDLIGTHNMAHIIWIMESLTWKMRVYKRSCECRQLHTDLLHTDLLHTDATYRFCDVNRGKPVS